MFRRLVMVVMMLVLGLAGPAMASHAAGMAAPVPVMEHHQDHQGECAPSGSCEAERSLCEFVCFGAGRLAMPPVLAALGDIRPARHDLPRDTREIAGLVAAIDHPPKPL